MEGDPVPLYSRSSDQLPTHQINPSEPGMLKPDPDRTFLFRRLGFATRSGTTMIKSAPWTRKSTVGILFPSADREPRRRASLLGGGHRWSETASGFVRYLTPRAVLHMEKDMAEMMGYYSPAVEW
jgi:hypothetical protein